MVYVTFITTHYFPFKQDFAVLNGPVFIEGHFNEVEFSQYV